MLALSRDDITLEQYCINELTRHIQPKAYGSHAKHSYCCSANQHWDVCTPFKCLSLVQTNPLAHRRTVWASWRKAAEPKVSQQPQHRLVRQRQSGICFPKKTPVTHWCCTHRQTHTQTNTHRETDKHTHTHVRPRAHTHAHTHMRAHTRTRTHTHAHVPTHTLAPTHTCTHSCTDTYTPNYT